jgi:hypothetical protein
VQLGGHGVILRYRNSPEMVSAGETSGPKNKTPTAKIRTENQNMLLQLIEILLPPIKEGSHLVCAQLGGHGGFLRD